MCSVAGPRIVTVMEATRVRILDVALAAVLSIGIGLPAAIPGTLDDLRVSS
jgi:hypothetical protein